MILEQYISSFVTYDLSPGVYSIKDRSEVVYTMGDHGGTLKLEYDDFAVKIKLILTRFGSTFRTSSFDEKFFFKKLLGFPAFWDYKPTNAIYADSTGV